MADELSTRDDIENDCQELKDATFEPAKRELGNKINDLVQDQLNNAIQDTANQTANQVANETANQATNQIASQTANQTALATTGGAATESAAVASAGAGTTLAAGEAAATAGATMTSGAAAAAAEGAAVGSAAGPIGAIIGVLIGLLATAVANEVNVSIDPDDPDAPKVPIPLVLFIAFILFLMLFCGTILSKGISGVLAISQETEFQNTVVEHGLLAAGGHGALAGAMKTMAQAGIQFSTGAEIPTYDYKLPLKNGISLYTYGKDGKGINDGFRASLSKAVSQHCRTIIEKLEEKAPKVRDKPYNSVKSLEIFYDNPFPYDIGSYDFTPRIGDVLHIDGYRKDYLARYDDVNYAEVIAILSMSDHVNGSSYGFNWGQANFEDFMAFTQKEECYKYLYELGLKWVPVYEGDKEVEATDENGLPCTNIVHIVKDGDAVGNGPYDSAEECAGADEEVEYDGVTLTFTEYYIRSTVKPFGLRELFMMAFGDTGMAYEKHVEFNSHDNLYMLNYAERVTRLYQRNFKIIIHASETLDLKVDALGPSFRLNRNAHSPIYDELVNDEWLKSIGLNGTGRSAWYYIEKTFNDKFESIEFPDDEPTPDPPEPKPFIPPGGGKILDMYEYVNQGNYPNVYRGKSGETVKKSGCLDCSIDMIIMYYLREHIPIQNISQYVNSSGALETGTVLSKYGFTQGGNNYSNFKDGVINEIENDRPVIIHIRGYWKSTVTGAVLHSSSNGHFLVGIGYDETGIWVNDPGNRNNHHIDYVDWNHVGDLYYRPVYKK